MPTEIKQNIAQAVEKGRLLEEDTSRRSLPRRAFAPFLQALRSWQKGPQYRSTIIYYITGFWVVGWALWFFLVMVLQPPANTMSDITFGFTLLLGFSVVVIGVAAGSMSPWSAGGAAGYAVIAIVIWVVGMALLFSSQFLSLFWLFVAGVGLIIVLGLVALFIPMWRIEVKPRQVYLVSDEQVQPEKFRFVSRPQPRIDPEVLDDLEKHGLSRALISRFLDFNGPVFMRQDLEAKVKDKPGGKKALARLFEQMGDPSRQQEPVMWFAARDELRLLWNKSDTIDLIELQVDRLITKEGYSVAIELTFKCDFDPEAIRSPEFRMKAAEKDQDTLIEILKGLARLGAVKAAQLYFVTIPQRAALTTGSIQRLRERLPDDLDWLKNVGLTVKPESVFCRPIVPDEVKQAETSMLASRPGAQAETARIQALVEQVIQNGVPPKLLAGLLMLDSGPEKWLQTSFNDMTDLPMPDTGQELRYFLQKHLEKQDQDPPELPEIKPPKQLPGSRRGINIGQRLNASRATDGTYRVQPDEEDEDESEDKP